MGSRFALHLYPFLCLLYMSRAQAYPHLVLHWLRNEANPALQPVESHTFEPFSPKCGLFSGWSLVRSGTLHQCKSSFMLCHEPQLQRRPLQMGSILPASAPSLSAAANAPLGLTSFALSLLLVFRTNTSYARWAEAREIWGGITNRSRDILRQVRHQECKKHTKICKCKTNHVACLTVSLLHPDLVL